MKTGWRLYGAYWVLVKFDPPYAVASWATKADAVFTAKRIGVNTWRQDDGNLVKDGDVVRALELAYKRTKPSYWGP